MKNVLGPAIKQLRIQKKLTQKDLSKLTGFSQNAISNHENQNRA
ncbi:helix-turn-helix transcriptional regulator, partial [Enterococcus asini]